MHSIPLVRRAFRKFLVPSAIVVLAALLGGAPAAANPQRGGSDIDLLVAPPATEATECSVGVSEWLRTFLLSWFGGG